MTENQSQKMTSSNRQIISRLYRELYANWDMSLIDELIHTDFTDHNMPPGIPAGPEGFRQFYNLLLSAFPDLRYSVQAIISEEDRVVVQWEWHATHQGEFLGVPPTGRDAGTTGMAIYRLRDGMVMERWVQVDLFGLMGRLRM